MSGVAKLSRKPNAAAAAAPTAVKAKTASATAPKTAKPIVKKIEMEIDDNESIEENGVVASEEQEEQIIEVEFPNSLFVMDPDRGGEIIQSIGQDVDDGDKIVDAAAALDESMQKTAPYREKLSPFVKSFLFNRQATEAKLAATAEKPSTQEDEEVDDDAPPTGAKKKRAIAVADERIFDLSGDFLSMPFARARMVENNSDTATGGYAVVKYLNPKLPHLTNNSITKSPVRVIYAGIKLAELPFSKAVLGGVSAGSKDVAHALQRIGSRVYLGGVATGGYVSFPGLCKSNFEALEVVTHNSPAFQRLGKPHAICTAETLAAAATVVSLASDDNTSIDFFHVEPIRITQSAYVAHLTAQKELVQKQILKDEQLAKSVTRFAKRRLDIIESFIEFVTDGGEVEPSDNIILHTFLYREFDAAAVREATIDLFPSVFVAPEPSDIVSSEKALKAAVKHKDIFDFVNDNLNQTFVEITASPQYILDDSETMADTVRFLVRVPIIPRVSWISLQLMHQNQQAGAATSATAATKKTAPAGATTPAKSPNVPKKAAATTKSAPSSQQKPAATTKTTTIKTKKTVDSDEDEDGQEAQDDADEDDVEQDDADEEDQQEKVAATAKKNRANETTAKKTANVVESTPTKANIAAATSAAATVEKLNNKKRKQAEQSIAAAFLEETEDEVVTLPAAVKGGVKGAPKANKALAEAAVAAPPPHEGPVDMDEDVADDEEQKEPEIKTAKTKGGAAAATKEKTTTKKNKSSSQAAPVMSASGRGYDFNKNEDMYAELHELGRRTHSQQILYEILMRMDNMLETLPDDNKNVISKVMAARLGPEVANRDMAPKEARDLATSTAQFLRLAGCGHILKAFRDSEIDEVVTTREERAARLEKERLEAEELAKAEAEAIAQAEAARAEKEKAEKAVKAKAAKAKAAAKEKAEADAKAKAEAEAAAAAAAAAAIAEEEEEEKEEEEEASDDFFKDA